MSKPARLPTATIKLKVSSERLVEWLEFIEAVEPTTRNPIAGDRILTLARTAIDLEHRRREYQRDWRRRQRGA
tara:strand:- start:2734 stop:2952 length:219 start_codon:yes stop_codon:yes gene_type:complete